MFRRRLSLALFLSRSFSFHTTTSKRKLAADSSETEETVVRVRSEESTRSLICDDEKSRASEQAGLPIIPFYQYGNIRVPQRFFDVKKVVSELKSFCF